MHVFSRNCPWVALRWPPPGLTVTANGGHPKTSSTIKVNPNLGDCGWTTVSNDEFITITDGASGTGKGSVAFSVPANTNTTALTGSISIGDETFTVTQAGAK